MLDNITPYVYRLERRDTGHFYYGSRVANKLPAEQDPYMGSGQDPMFRTSKFEKVIVAKFDSKEAARNFELKCILEHKDNPMCLNKAAWPLWCMSGRRWSEESRNKQRLAKLQMSEETKEKLRLAKLGIKRKPFSEETKRKMRTSQQLRRQQESQ
jgi:hypothetical protein